MDLEWFQQVFKCSLVGFISCLVPVHFANDASNMQNVALCITGKIPSGNSRKDVMRGNLVYSAEFSDNSNKTAASVMLKTPLF